MKNHNTFGSMIFQWLMVDISSTIIGKFVCTSLSWHYEDNDNVDGDDNDDDGDDAYYLGYLSAHV